MALKTYPSLYHLSLDYSELYHGDRPGTYVARDPVDGLFIDFVPRDGEFLPILHPLDDDPSGGHDRVSEQFIFHDSGWEYCPECHERLIFTEATTYIDKEDGLYILGNCVNCEELVDMEVIPRRFLPKET